MGQDLEESFLEHDVQIHVRVAQCFLGVDLELLCLNRAPLGVRAVEIPRDAAFAQASKTKGRLEGES